MAECKLGELLCGLGLIDEEGLRETLKMAARVGLPLGRALVLSGHITDADLKTAIDIQSLIRQGQITLETASVALELVRKENLTLMEALTKLGWRSTKELQAPGNTLGSLLVDSGIITPTQLSEASRVSVETGQPLGRMLILMGALSHSVLAKALDLQTQVRDSKMGYIQATKQLRTFKASRTTLAASLSHLTGEQALGRPKKVRLGEFLMLAGVLTESDILSALEMGLSKQQSVGDSLIELGMLSQPVLDAALDLQEKICTGQMELNDASDRLHRFASLQGLSPKQQEAAASAQREPASGLPGEAKPAVRTDFLSSSAIASASAVAEQKEEPLVLGELLRATGLVNEDDVRRAIELCMKYHPLIGKMLVISGAIDEPTLIASLRCQFLLRHHFIKRDEAISALRYAHENTMSFDDALIELGVRLPPTARRDLIGSE